MNYPDGYKIRKIGTVCAHSGAPEKPFDLTFDFSGASHEIVAKYAVRGMTIDRQRKYRNDLKKGKAPTAETINVAATLVSGRTIMMVREPTKEEILEQAASMTSEALRALLADVEAREESSDNG